MYVYVGKYDHRSNLCFRECGNVYIEIRSAFKTLKEIKALILLKAVDLVP